MINLEELNIQMEQRMVQEAKDRLEMTIKSGGEHSLPMSTLIKKVTQKCYDVLHNYDIPFDIYKQSSSYIIASELIGVIYDKVDFRDFIRELHGKLGWNIQFPEEYMDNYRKERVTEYNSYHTRIIHNFSLIIKEEQYSEILHSFRNSPLQDFEGIVNRDIIDEIHRLIGLMAYYRDRFPEFDSMIDVVNEYYTMLRGMFKHHSINVNYELIGRITTTPRKRSTIERINQKINILNSLMSNPEESVYCVVEMEWLSYLLSEIISNVVEVEVTNGDVVPCIVGTQRTQKKFFDMVDEISVLRPVSKPMIVKPLPWTKGESEGGFLSIRKPLTSGRHENQKLPEWDYLRSVNTIQGTAFRVNGELTDAVECIGYLIDPSPKKQGWSSERRRRYAESAKSKNRDMSRIMSIADEYDKFSEIFFTCYSDFRGRVYFSQHYLQPQGHDLAKACLEFAEGKKIDKKGLRWLKIHLANLAGFDKLPFKERVRWVTNNTKMLVNIANDPTGSTVKGNRSTSHKEFIEKADKPYQFLAACIEYKNYLLDPDNFLSRLPVAMDGVCNGTQHWCAMLKDKVGGAKVALINADKPSDLYTDVLGNLNKILQAFECIESINWVNMYGSALSRKLVKTPTMTTTYSAGKKAFRGHAKSYCVDNGYVFSDDASEQSQHEYFIVDRMVEAIDKTVSARSGMKFVQECVSGKEFVEWKTPIGFNVYMQPMRTFKREFKVMIDGRVRNVTFAFEGDNTDGLSMGTGVAPNYVHSMDAAHMLLVVNACELANPGMSWMMVHDSYATHACDVELMQRQIRVQFVALYAVDRLEEFRKYVGVNIPLPEYGDLDINDVLKSAYFFS